MQISFANTGSYFSPGPFASPGTAVEPTVRKPDAGPSSDANRAVLAASDARTLQRIAPPVTPTNSEASRALVLARQQAGFDGLSGVVPVGQSGNEAAVQRAVAEYSAVATQEQRFELDDVLAGIDVFA